MDMFRNYYDIGQLIGEGSFGKVYKAECLQTKNVVACKVISKTGRCSSEIDVLRKECEIQQNLSHRNIIRMLGSFETDGELVVITEYAEKDLCQILKEEGVLQENRAKIIICDIVLALQYLHEQVRVLHRDLKPQNVLLDSHGSAKVCDFGFAKVLKKDNALLTSVKGTPLYMAPELINQWPYNHKADLWSLGCIAYELVTGHPPFTTSLIWQLIKMIKDESIKWPHFLSEACLSLLKGLLQKNPEYRLSWPHLLYHPFVKDYVCLDVSRIGGYRGVNLPFYSESINLHFQGVHSPYSYSVNEYNNRTRTNQIILSSSEKSATESPFSDVSEKSVSHKSRDRISHSHEVNECHNRCDNHVEDIELTVQKEEWLDFLRKTIHSVMYDGDVDVLVEKHSLMLIMNAFNGCNTCPIIVATISRLLSLPFVVESVSEAHLRLIKQTYVYCNIMKDLLTVVERIVIKKSEFGKIKPCYETALQLLFLLICNLTFKDQILLNQFFKACISLKLFKIIKNCLSIRTKNDRFSIVKYVISIFLRLYVLIPESRSFIFTAFEDCISEFHSLLQEYEDNTVHLRLCTFITVLSCTQSNFFKKSPGIQMLIQDLTQLKNRSNIPSTQQTTQGALEVLKNLERQQ